MTVLRLAKDLLLPDQAVTETFLVFGKRGSGKSSTATRLAEQFIRRGIPIAVLDPADVWWGLKAGADGEKGGGLPVYVFGGEHPDLPLEPTGGSLMADVLVDERINAVMVIRAWSNRDKARFVSDFAERLFARNREPLHLFAEEAHELMPQQIQFKGTGEEEMLGRMLRIVKLGRQPGIGLSAITQRPASLNKNVTTQAEILIAHRLIGAQDLDAVEAWIKHHGDREGREQVLSTLPTLRTGEAWLWSPAFPEDKPIGLRQVAIAMPETFDSRKTPRPGERRAEPRALAEVDRERLSERMAATIERAKAEDPKELRKRIRELEGQVAKAGQNIPRTIPEPEVIEKVVEVPVLNGQVDALVAVLGELRTVGTQLDAVAGRISLVGGNLSGVADSITSAIARVQSPGVAQRAEPAPRPISPRERVDRGTRTEIPVRVRAPEASPAEEPSAGNAGSLRAGARRMLSALAWLHPTPLTRAQLGMLAKVAPGGTFSSYLSNLRLAGLADIDHLGLVALTEAGVGMVADELGNGAPSTAELVELWSRRLRAGARRMLEELVRIYPEGLSRAELGERTDVAPGGTFSSYLSNLRNAGLLDESSGELRASASLFLGSR